MKNLLKYILPSLLIGALIGWVITTQLSSGKQTSSTEEHSEHAHEGEQIYTCSMHPQIRQPEPGICPICEMDLIPLEENTSNDPYVLEMTEAAAELANVQTTPVGTGSGTTTNALRLSGKVAADESRRASQVSHLPGRIEKLYVRFTGAPIQAGQKLADIYSPDLITAQRELIEAKKMTSFNPDLLEAARQKLRYWKLTEEQIAELEANATIQEVFSIYADASGIVDQRRVAVGDYVGRGEVLYDILDLSSVWVLFDAYERDLDQFSVGDRIQFTTPAFPERVFAGRVSFIDPLIDPQTRVATLRVEVRNPGGRLKPGMLVTGRWEKAVSSDGALLVPESAVLWTGTRSVVYVKVANTEVPSFQYREVELGQRVDDHYQILAGLEAGEEVVVNGAFTIDAAAQLNNQASMMNTQVRLKGMSGMEAAVDFTDDTPLAFKEQLDELVGAYLSVKDALVQSDSTAAAAAGAALQSALTGMDASALPEEARAFWSEKSNGIAAHLENFVAAQGIEAQRRQFGFFSNLLIEALQALGHEQGTYYVQHCPMAFDDDGADWISAEEEIRNPYFGDRMLKCGLVEAEIEGVQ